MSVCDKDHGAPVGDGSDFPAMDPDTDLPLHDIAFPFNDACQTIQKSRELADVLDHVREARLDKIGAYLDDWEGGFRDDFDDQTASEDAELEAVATDLRSYATNLEGRAEEMATENATRAARRLAWSDRYTPGPGGYLPYDQLPAD